MRRSLLRGLRLTLLLAVLSAVLAAPAAAQPSVVREVRLTAEGFSPASLRVPAGLEVRWVNATDAVQTLLGEDGSFDSGPLRPGESFALVPRVVGDVRYATADGAAEGRLRVLEEGSGSAAAGEPAVVLGLVALPETGASAPVLLTSAGALLLAGAGLLRAAARRDGTAPRAPG